MKQTKLKIVTTSCALALLLAACGGGGGSGGGTAGNTYVGTISSFGSVTVDGVKFETDDSDFEIEDDADSDESELEVGQRVVIRGTVNEDGVTGTAHSIEYDDNLEGIVNTDLGGANTGTMVIMGQSVEISVTTVVESDVAGITSASQITAGMIVEVSGIPTADDAITATFIEVKAVDLATYIAAGGEIEIKGSIANLNLDTMTFNIGGLAVVYSLDTVFDDIPNTGLAEGMFVEVKSVVDFDGEGRLVASEIEAEHDSANDHDDDDGVEFDGEITTAWEEGATSIGVNGIEILLTETTELEGLGYDGLTLGRMVEVEVSIVDGIYTALEIEVEHSEEEVEGHDGIVTEIVMTDEDRQLERNIGTVTAGELTFQINLETIMEDDSVEGVEEDTHFNLTDLATGDLVIIYFVEAGDQLVAVKLERRPAPGTDSVDEI